MFLELDLNALTQHYKTMNVYNTVRTKVRTYAPLRGGPCRPSTRGRVPICKTAAAAAAAAARGVVDRALPCPARSVPASHKARRPALHHLALAPTSAREPPGRGASRRGGPRITSPAPDGGPRGPARAPAAQAPLPTCSRSGAMLLLLLGRRAGVGIPRRVRAPRRLKPAGGRAGSRRVARDTASSVCLSLPHTDLRFPSSASAETSSLHLAARRAAAVAVTALHESLAVLSRRRVREGFSRAVLSEICRGYRASHTFQLISSGKAW